jgi:hypothetical protein
MTKEHKLNVNFWLKKSAMNHVRFLLDHSLQSDARDLLGIDNATLPNPSLQSNINKI